MEITIKRFNFEPSNLYTMDESDSKIVCYWKTVDGYEIGINRKRAYFFDTIKGMYESLPDTDGNIGESEEDLVVMSLDKDQKIATKSIVEQIIGFVDNWIDQIPKPKRNPYDDGYDINDPTPLTEADFEGYDDSDDEYIMVDDIILEDGSIRP